MCLPSVEMRPAMKLSYLEPRRGNTKNEHVHNRRDGAGVGMRLSSRLARPRTRVSPWRAKSCQSEHARTKSKRYGRLRTVLPAATDHRWRLRTVLQTATDGGGYGRCFRRSRAVPSAAATNGARSGGHRWRYTRPRTVPEAAAMGGATHGHGRCHRSGYSRQSRRNVKTPVEIKKPFHTAVGSRAQRCHHRYHHRYHHRCLIGGHAQQK